jgi:hypothetical protein
MNQVYIIENFLSKEETDLVNSYLEKNEPQSDPSGYSPYKNYTPTTDKNILNCFNNIYPRMKSYIENSFNCLVYDEGLASVVELNVGDSMPLHLDHGSAMNKSVGLKTGSGHPTRDISCVLYYNDNYVGGEICFPNQNIVLKPKAGTFIYFPAEDNFPHEVKTVTKGSRWFSTVFWCIKKD